MIYAPAATANFQAWFGERLDSLASDVSGAVGDNLAGLILGGGYGRGEGGVVTSNGRELPYNDLDLTIVVNEPARLDMRRLAAIGHKAGEELGIEVDFSRPLAPSDVQNWQNTLMWHDLLNGHVVLAGDSDLLRKLAPPALSAEINATEALRLLLNRGSGLLWAMAVVRGDEPCPDPDFVRRNAYKCLLALGDAILITHKKYNTQYTGRDGRLDTLCVHNDDIRALDIQAAYRAALTFKFTPDLAPEINVTIGGLRELVDLWNSVLLHVERHRHGAACPMTIREYTDWAGVREAEQNLLSLWPKNAVQNAMLGRLSVRYPREHLYRVLPTLLASEATASSEWPRLVREYLRIWKRFN